MKDGKKLFKSIAAVIVVLALFRLFAAFAPISGFSTEVQLIIKQSFSFLLGLIALFVLKKLDVLKFKLEGFGTGLAVGAVMLLIIIGSIAKGIFSGNVSFNMTLLLTFIGYLIVGIGEETLYRGILQNAFHEYFGENSVSDVRKALLFAGILFGAAHLTNIFSGAPIAGAVTQAIWSVCAGMIYGTVYYRSKRNIWVAALIHGLWDVSSGFAFSKTGASASGAFAALGTEGYIGLIIVAAGAIIVSTLLVLFLTRKKKIEPLLSK